MSPVGSLLNQHRGSSSYLKIGKAITPASSPDVRPSHQRQLSTGSQPSTDSSSSSHDRSSSDGTWSPPRSHKATPASSVEATSQHGGSKSSSRTTSSEFTSPASDQSSAQNENLIHCAEAQVVSFDWPVSSCNLLTKLGWGHIRLPQDPIGISPCRLVQ